MVNQQDALNAWRRGLMGSAPAAEPSVEGPGLLMQAADIASRPVSAVMGGFFGALSPEVTVGEGIKQGLTGERSFSAYDFALEAGANPESKVTRYGSLAADILNPADPLNYVGLGYTKAGKVARALTKAGEGSEKFGRVTSRAVAASKGLWSPLTFAGHAVVPKTASVPVARVLDAAANRITKSAYVEKLGQYFGGVRKFEEAVPGLARAINEGKQGLKVGEQEFIDEIGKVREGLKARGLDDAQARQALEDVTHLLESPEVRAVELEREKELVEGALAGQMPAYQPQSVLPEDVGAITQVNVSNQRAVDRRVAELTQARRQAEFEAELNGTPLGGPAAPEAPKAPGLPPVSPLEDTIRKGALELAGGQTETRVRLADLRERLSGFSREEQDAMLKQMQQDGKLVLYRLDDPQDTFPADEAAALMLGNDPRHLVYLKPAALDAPGPGTVEHFAAPAAPKLPEAIKKIDDELHVLKSVQVARFAKDVPPQDVLAARRAQLEGEINRIRALWDDAGPNVHWAYEALRPLLDKTKGMYEEVLKKYDPNFEFPVQDYLKHMFPVTTAQLPENLSKAQAKVAAAKEALIKELAAQGHDEQTIARMVHDRLGPQGAILDLQDRAGILKGDLDAFKQRQYNMTIDEFNKQALEGGLNIKFETYSAAIAQAMQRDASRWRFAHDLHKMVIDKPGWSISAEEYGKLSKAEQKGWKALEFHVPWIDQAKNPFKDKYIKREADAIMQSQLAGMRKLLTDDGMNALLQGVNTFRQWWVAWTLAPFPGTRVRDLVSDMVMGAQAGLNPAVDLARAPMGRSMYMASLALNTRRSKLGAVRGMFKQAPESLQHILDSVERKFGTKLDEAKLGEYMEIEGILDPSAVRDLDIEAVLSNDPLLQAERKKRGLARKLQGGFTLNPEKSPIIKTGFKVAKVQADFTRSALFFHSLMEALPDAKNLDDALQVATATVRRHLFDYTDLTQIERDVLKNFIPFYTFTAKNLPQQISTAVTQPGKFEWINRLYQGAWQQFDDGEVQPEDLPQWLQDSLGMPLSKTRLDDGTETYSIWTPRGWLPQTELNEMADLIRGKAGEAILSRLSPLLKEPFEQMLNRDAFTMRDIEDGTVRDIFGFPQVPRSALHMLNNLRLVNEVDRLDPGGLWTKIGKQLGYWEGDERPHRWTAPGVDRGTQFLTGLNIKGVAPAEQAERNFRDADRERNAALSRMRYALRRGQTYEAEKFMETVSKWQTEAKAAMARLNELRRRNALDVARRERRGVGS